MKTAAAISLAIVLAGCATPAELRRDGVRTDYTLRLPPAQAARCMVRNAEEFWGALHATVRDSDTSSVFEVQVRANEQLAAIAEITAKGKGAITTIWNSRIMLFAQGLPDAMVGGC